MKRRVLLTLAVVAVLAGATASVSAAPAGAYGKANWQAALTGTFEFPPTGFGLGFWGWCDFAGGVTSGDDADCEIAEYFHNPRRTSNRHSRASSASTLQPGMRVVSPSMERARPSPLRAAW